ncbi:MAG: hypothetical protein GWP75_13915 [Planctomycetia bacterium]|nr:hypothetical protein [Planctomycetia bacterium]
MNGDRIIQAAAGIGILAALISWFGIVPLHARASSQEAETASLLTRVAASPMPADRLVPFRRELERRVEMLDRECPSGVDEGPPDLAGIIRALSLPIDGSTVIDQTFTAERSGPTGFDLDLPWAVTPVRIELTASWSAIANVLESIEAMAAPNRMTEFRLDRDLEPDVEIARVSIEIEVLHRVSQSEEQ